jgi:hypothetical protein
MEQIKKKKRLGEKLKAKTRKRKQERNSITFQETKTVRDKLPSPSLSPSYFPSSYALTSLPPLYHTHHPLILLLFPLYTYTHTHTNTSLCPFLPPPSPLSQPQARTNPPSLPPSLI